MFRRPARSRWAYNEPDSHSGYNAVRYHLATLGERAGYFGEAIGSGAHQTSLQWLLDRKVDASAIDSTVLEFACLRDPGLRKQLHRIATFGPVTMPPWIVLKSVSQRDSMRVALLAMHETSEGAGILAQAQVARFARVGDRDYDVIRKMADVAAGVELAAAPVAVTA